MSSFPEGGAILSDNISGKPRSVSDEVSESNQALFILEKVIDFTSHDSDSILKRLGQEETVVIDPIDAYYLSETDRPQPSTGRLIYSSEIRTKAAEVVVFEASDVAA